MNIIDIGMFVVVILGYIFVAVGFHMEMSASMDSAPESQNMPWLGLVKVLFAAIWPVVLLIRIGQFIANPNPLRIP